MFLTASKVYRDHKQAGESVTACLDRLNAAGNKVYKNGRKLTSLEIPLLASVDNVLVDMSSALSSNSIKAFSTPRFEMLPFQNLQRSNCEICKSNNSCIAIRITSVPGTICTICRATDFADSIKDILKDTDLLQSFDKGYQVAELVA